MFIAILVNILGTVLLFSAGTECSDWLKLLSNQLTEARCALIKLGQKPLAEHTGCWQVQNSLSIGNCLSVSRLLLISRVFVVSFCLSKKEKLQSGGFKTFKYSSNIDLLESLAHFALRSLFFS